MAEAPFPPDLSLWDAWHPAHPLSSEALRKHHQTWVREPATGAWRLDVMREPWEGGTWG
jgi:hypothetical protein